MLSRGERWCISTKRGKRPTAANHCNAVFAYESNGIKPDLARSRQPAAGCFYLCMQRLFPADWHLMTNDSYAACTEILRLRLRMTVRAGEWLLRSHPLPPLTRSPSAPVGSVSLDSQLSADSLRIQLPCHLASRGRQERNADYKTHRRQRRRYLNPRAKGPSNLRTFVRFAGVKPKNPFVYNPSSQPAAKPRPLEPSEPGAAARPLFHGPLNLFQIFPHGIQVAFVVCLFQSGEGF